MPQGFTLFVVFASVPLVTTDLIACPFTKLVTLVLQRQVTLSDSHAHVVVMDGVAPALSVSVTGILRGESVVPPVTMMCPVCELAASPAMLTETVSVAAVCVLDDVTPSHGESGFAENVT